MDELKITKQTEFTSGGGTQLILSEIVDRINKYYLASPDSTYRLSIGTDSMTHEDTKFVLAIVLHRVGSGGIYFYKKYSHRRVESLREKLYAETRLSIDATELLLEAIMEKNEELFEKLNLSIHLDIGENGPTKALIRELEGWVHSLGYEYAIKPDSYAASSIADIHTK